jgi:hypothetical protein
MPTFLKYNIYLYDISSERSILIRETLDIILQDVYRKKKKS